MMLVTWVPPATGWDPPATGWDPQRVKILLLSHGPSQAVSWRRWGGVFLSLLARFWDLN